VVIVGAGPTGLMLSAELALAGVDVAVVERRANRALVGARAGGLHSRTIEILDQRGVADRFLQQAALKAEGGLTREKADTIGRFLTISGDPVKAARELDRFQREMHIDIAEAVATFRARSKAMKALGIDLASLAFRADFGRNLDYYTGFVFEIRDPARRDGKPVVGGGRYDGLIERLGARVSVPAVGFSMWLDRLAGVELDGGLA